MPAPRHLRTFNQSASVEHDDFKIAGTLDESSVSKVIAAAGGVADAISVGDTNHTNKKVLGALDGKEMIKGLAEAGCHHVAIEIPQEYDEHIQALHDGSISKKEFIDAMKKEGFVLVNDGDVTLDDFLESKADMILRARACGMEVHGVDPGIKDMPSDKFMDSKAVQKADTSFTKELSAACTSIGQPLTTEFIEKFLEDAKTRERFLRRLPGKTRRKVEKEYKNLEEISEEDMKKAFEEFMKERVEDSDLYKNVKAIADGEKVAIVYGAGHDRIINKMDGNAFNRNKVLVIDVCADKDEMIRHNDYTNKLDTAKGQPDLIYLEKEGKFLITDHGMQKPWIKKALEEQGIDIEELDKPMKVEDLQVNRGAEIDSLGIQSPEYRDQVHDGAPQMA